MTLVFLAAMLFAATSSVLCVPVKIQQRTYNEVAAAPVPELDALWKRNPSLCALLLHIALDLNLRSPSTLLPAK